jgi:hypothetical protein
MKEINFLGQTFQVLEDQDIETALESDAVRYYGVPRVSDVPAEWGSPQLRARRLRTVCEVCSQVCWMDPESMDALKGLPVKIICTHCLIAEVDRRKGDASD